MQSNFTQLYLHCVWSTWGRLPLLTPDIRQEMYRAVVGRCTDWRCKAIAIGGIEDHVHLLTEFPSTLTVADLVKNVKGSSSHLVTHALKPHEFFKWQGGYGAFTVSRNQSDQIANYIRKQEIHHRDRTIVSGWEIDGAVD